MSKLINVLFIEDNPGDARLVREELQAVSSKTVIQLEWVDRLEKGLQRLTANNIKAVLLDLNLPDSTGFNTLQRVLSHAPDTAVIVMTGQADEESGIWAVQKGAQDYLVKGQVDGRLLTRSIQYAIQRKRTEEALRVSEERFRLVVQSAPNAMIVVDKQGAIILANTTAENLFGYSANELLGQPVELLVPGQLREEHTHLHQEYLAQPQAIAIGLRRLLFGLHKDGHEIPLEIGLAPYHSSEGLCVLALINDITGRKAAEEKLAASEAKLRALFAAMQDVVLIIDKEGIYREIAPTNPSLLAYPPEILLGKSLRDIFSSERAEEFLAIIKDVVGREEARQIEYQLQIGGRTVWFSTNITPMGSDATVWVAHEITDRKQAEETLREKERLLSEAQAIGHVGSWSYDIPADTLLFSDEMYRLLDIPPNEFQHNSKGFLARIYPSDRTMAAKWIEDIRAGLQVRQLDFHIFRKTGELCYLHCTGAVEFNSDGKPVRFIGTAQDVTERRLADIQIKQHIKRLTALGEIDRAIISSLDQRHTLNIILAHVISQLQIDAADILLWNSASQNLEFVAGRGFRTKQIETVRMQIGESYAGRAATEQQMIQIPDLRDEPADPSFNSRVADESFVGYIGIPLVVKEKLKGVLEVFQRRPLQPFQEWLDFLNTLAGQTAIAIENANLFDNLERSNRELSQAYQATIEGWSRALDLRDKETEGHTLRVTEMTMNLAREFGFTEPELLQIRHGALLHDIGKMGVPDHILLKPEPLTQEEETLMQMHPRYAYDLLQPITFLESALAIPYCHHEKWDGTGYPRGLKGDEIPIAARLFSLADVWDALTSDRPYRPAWTEEKALEYIREQSGKHFDPEVVKLFFKVIGKEPPPP